MTREELENQKIEGDAQRAAETEAKKQAKKQVIKVIWNKVKIAVIPMLLMLVKVFAVVLSVCLVVTFMTISIGEGDDGEDEEYNSTAEETTITSQTSKLSNVQIQNYINNYNTTNMALKQELLIWAVEIENWQSNYGYSANLLITIAFEEIENKPDTGEPRPYALEVQSFMNEMNIKGQIWSTEGYDTVQEIAQDYVGDETTVEWANNIENKMQENSRSDTN